MDTLTAVILSGGASRRMGRDKASLVLQGRTLLERTAAGVRAAGAARIVVVGDPPADAISPSSALTGARFVREQPPGGGPVPALEAALAVVDTPWMLVVPCDLAYPEAASRALVEATRAIAASGGSHGAVAVDADGHRQHLTALLDAAALRRSAVRGTARVRDWMAPLTLSEVPEPEGSAGLWEDMDTPEDVARVRAGRGAAVTGGGTNEVPGLQDWMDAVVQDLGLPPEVIVPSPLLDVARDVANTVIRPGAPMSTYLIGVALGLRLAGGGTGGNGADAGQEAEQQVVELATRVQQLAARYAEARDGEH